MAIDDLLDEHEQSERVRSWLRGNAAGLIGGIGLGLAAIAGWHWWQGNQLGAQMQANAEYAQIVGGLQAGTAPATGGLSQIQALSDRNPTLAALAAMQMAKSQVDAGNRDGAIATLRGISVEDPAMRAVVEQRLARLLIDAGKGKEALSLLSDARNPATLAIRGDAEMALGERAKAREAYAKALGLVDVADPQHRLLQLKLIEAGGTPPHTEDRT